VAPVPKTNLFSKYKLTFIVSAFHNCSEIEKLNAKYKRMITFRNCFASFSYKLQFLFEIQNCDCIPSSKKR